MRWRLGVAAQVVGQAPFLSVRRAARLCEGGLDLFSGAFLGCHLNEQHEWLRGVAERRLHAGGGRARARSLLSPGKWISDTQDHDDSEYGVSKEVNESVFVRSIYFFDPDGILLEFAAWTRALNEDDVRHAPATSLARS